MTLIEDFDATFEKHRKQVETLIRRQATSRKVAKHFRLNVLKRQLESGRLLPSQIQDRTRFEPDLVQLAIAASKSLARGNSVTSQHDFLGSSDSSGGGGGSSGGGDGDGGGRSMPRRPEGGYPHHQQHNKFYAGSRGTRRHRRPRQSTTAQQQLRDTQNAKAMVAANKAARSFHPLVHVFGNRNGVQDGIHVTEGGACDYYNVRLVRRPTSLVHIAIQDSHLQTIIEPRVLRFSEQDWSTPQLVCVSAIDDTDKSSESVESTVLEHVTASGDKDYNDIRFEVPVHIADNDGYYLWGFGSNAHRQFGVDDVGPGACLPASITCELIEENGDDHERDNDSESDESDGQDDNDNEDGDRRRGGGGGGGSSSLSSSSSSPGESKKRINKRASFVTNAKMTKPSMLFSSVAAGRYTSCATQTNGETTMHGRNDGSLWYGSRLLLNSPFSRRVGTKSSFIISVSAGSNHCMALSVGGLILAWGENDHGQLGIGINEEGEDDGTAPESVQTPVRVKGPWGSSQVLQVSCGNKHTAAIAGEKLYTWGLSRTGALGLHAPEYVARSSSSPKQRRRLPVYVPGLSDERSTEDTTKMNKSSLKDAKNDRNETSPSTTTIVATTTSSSGSSSDVGSDRYFPCHARVTLLERRRRREEGGRDESDGVSGNNGDNSKSNKSDKSDKSGHGRSEGGAVPFQVDCSWGHTAVICGDGSLYTCGWGANGRLGRVIPGGGHHSGFLEAADPVFRQVQFPQSVAGTRMLVVNVSCGRQHTLALSSERELWSWGANNHGQLGLGHRVAQAVPRLVRILRPFSRDAVASRAASRRKREGNGEGNREGGVGNEGNGEGEGASLASGRTPPRTTTTSKEPSTDLLAAISCGDSHSCVVTEQGLLYVFGCNESSQLGLGDDCTADELFPRLHHPTLSLDVRQVSCGADHTLVVTGETPARVFHAKSGFDEIMLRHKKLVERDGRRRRKFVRMVTKAEEKRKREHRRRPISMMIPTTKKAHAMSMNIHHNLIKSDQRKRGVRPASASYDRRRRGGAGGGGSTRSTLQRSATTRDGTSTRSVVQWERSLSPRPTIDDIPRGKHAPAPVRPSRPSTAGNGRSRSRGGGRYGAVRPSTAGGGRSSSRGFR